jgi:membrane protein YdbS with pleckstrin-like domain
MTTMSVPDQPVESADVPDAAVPVPEVPDPPSESAPPSSIADGVERPLDPRSVAVQRIAGWLVAGPILAGVLLGLLLILFLADLPGWAMALLVLLGAAAALGLAGSAHRWPEIEHRHAAYKVDGRGIEIRRGVVWRKVINVPRSRVQHTDVSQGPLERSHGLATLVIYTAGTNHARVDLHGLDHATALLIRDHLLAGEGDDAV